MVPTVQFSQGLMSSITLQHLPQEQPAHLEPWNISSSYNFLFQNETEKSRMALGKPQISTLFVAASKNKKNLPPNLSP